MIDLKPAVGELVFLQLKRPTYVVIKQGPALMPLEMPHKDDPCRLDPSGRTPMSMPGEPMVVDYLIGQLEAIGEGFCLAYVEPVARARVKVLINTDDVAACFFEGKIQIVGADSMPQEQSKGE